MLMQNNAFPIRTPTVLRRMRGVCKFLHFHANSCTAMDSTNGEDNISSRGHGLKSLGLHAIQGGRYSLRDETEHLIERVFRALELPHRTYLKFSYVGVSLGGFFGECQKLRTVGQETQKLPLQHVRSWSA